MPVRCQECHDLQVKYSNVGLLCDSCVLDELAATVSAALADYVDKVKAIIEENRNFKKLLKENENAKD